MKLKYFMRGLGAGIIMITLLTVITYTPLTDDEIVQRAKELGMTYEEQVKPIIDDIPKDEPTKELTEEPTEKPIEEPIEELEIISHIDIQIKKGMDSYVVSKALQDNEIIEDARDFDFFLINQGYQHRIQSGTYSLTALMSYDEIAKVITK